MEFAIASGAIAAQAAKAAIEKGDFSAQTLSIYKDMLKDSFVLKDFNTFKNIPHFLENTRLFTVYPQLINELLGKLMRIDENPKEKLSTTMRKQVNCKQRILMLKDAIGAFKV
jgi:electron transfer flavoprotein-quinone oxidoreductase